MFTIYTSQAPKVRAVILSLIFFVSIFYANHYESQASSAVPTITNDIETTLCIQVPQGEWLEDRWNSHIYLDTDNQGTDYTSFTSTINPFDSGYFAFRYFSLPSESSVKLGSYNASSLAVTSLHTSVPGRLYLYDSFSGGSSVSSNDIKVCVYLDNVMKNGQPLEWISLRDFRDPLGNPKTSIRWNSSNSRYYDINYNGSDYSVFEYFQLFSATDSGSGASSSIPSLFHVGTESNGEDEIYTSTEFFTTEAVFQDAGSVIESFDCSSNTEGIFPGNEDQGIFPSGLFFTEVFYNLVEGTAQGGCTFIAFSVESVKVTASFFINSILDFTGIKDIIYSFFPIDGTFQCLCSGDYCIKEGTPNLCVQYNWRDYSLHPLFISIVMTVIIAYIGWNLFRSFFFNQ